MKAKWFAEHNCGYGGFIEKAWDAATNAVEQKFTSTNTGSPKLPTLVEAISGALGFKVSEVPGTDTGAAMKDMYDFICSQLRA